MRTIRAFSVFSIAVLLLACSPADVEHQQAAGSVFQSLLDEHWANSQQEKVFFRNDPDGWRMDGSLPDHSPQARERRERFNDHILQRLADINVSELSADEQLSYRIFKYERETERDSYQQLDRYFPIASMFGYHSYFADAPGNSNFLTADDYESYLISLADFTRYNRDYISILREAVERGYTQYCDSMIDKSASIERHIVANAETSKLFSPFTRFPGTINGDERARLIDRGTELINTVIVPGYEELLDFFVNEYLPACRTEVGVTSLVGGDEYYRYLIRYFTTTDLSPEEIHALGVSELERIRAEMQAIIDKVGFAGDFKAFVNFLRTDPQFYAKTDLELLGRAALISKTAEGELPRFFTHLPRATYKIVGDKDRGAFYVAPTGDGTDSGSYYIKIGDLGSQPLYALESLTLHEGVPGHHLQGTLAQELDVPEFRRNLYHSGFGEGWGLYSERLGKEMGFYQDPYSDFGRLTYEAWRACRLIVDTGMHSFGWTREQAIEFMLANTAVSQVDVINEVDRYITWPAQALAYKIGELKIRELRAKAEGELGSSFDIRRFHDIVVGNGSLPIAILEDVVMAWIENEKQAL